MAEQTKVGYLLKRGNWNPAFKNRYFELKYRAQSLTYSKSEEEKNGGNIQGTIDLRVASVKELPRDDKDYSNDGRAFALHTPRRVYILKAQSPAESAEWKQAIKDAVESGNRSDDGKFAQNAAQLQGGFDANAAEATEEELKAQLEQNRQVVGEKHPNTAVCLHNLAYYYSKNGELERSEQLYLQALKYLKEALGDEHQEVAVCTGNYAVCLKRQGRYAEALTTFKRALELAEKTWGAYDEKTSDILYNIYANFYAQGLYREAKPYLLRSLQINEKGLGANHPEVLQSQADLRDLEARIEQLPPE